MVTPPAQRYSLDGITRLAGLHQHLMSDVHGDMGHGGASAINARSPSCSFLRATGYVAAYWAAAVHGSCLPARRQAHIVRPEQSNPLPGLAPPRTYLRPI